MRRTPIYTAICRSLVVPNPFRMHPVAPHPENEREKKKMRKKHTFVRAPMPMRTPPSTPSLARSLSRVRDLSRSLSLALSPHLPPLSAHPRVQPHG